MKAGLLLASGGGVIGAVALASPAYLPIAIVAVAVIALATAVTLAIVRWNQKRKAKPFEQQLMSDASATPAGAGDARSMADLPELQRKFEEGVKTFRERGKDVYGVPWYLVVGPSGGGKTEAIRHSGVPMPAGLQDKLQGVGGTYQMHWWFTEESVILDTAGRLVTDSAREWEKFLKLLRKNRPHCPVNGLLLVIPADDLMRLSPGQIQEDGGKWADRLDDLQQALGVRFPVFIVVTKSDLVRGFRSFFGEMDEPSQMMQMMGWSNPAKDIDEEFRPQEVEQHLGTVVDRLRRRRMAMLLDPRSRTDPIEGRRLDEVDTLYDFPDQFAKLGERLRLYLESAFAAGAWSSKPLFVRGIYFTSSMEEGKEVDRLLADALGKNVDELAAGETFARKRSLFLRDMFTQKVFREQGLVTNAGNVKKEQRRNRLVAMGGAIAGVVLMIGATVYMARTFSQQIGRDNDFWKQVAASTELSEEMRVIADFDDTEGRAGYYGATELSSLDFPQGTVTIAELPTLTQEAASTRAKTAWPFLLAAAVSGNPYERRDEAHRIVFEQTVLEPMVSAALSQLAQGRGETGWRADAEVAALADLIRLERAVNDAGAGDGDGGPPIDLVALSRAAFDPGNNEGWAWANEGGDQRDELIEQRRQQVRDLQEVVLWTYGGGDGQGGATWPPEAMLDDEGRSRQLLLAAERMREHFTPSAEDGESRLGALQALVTRLEAFETAKQTLISDVDFSAVQTTEDYEQELVAWDEARARLDQERAALEEAADRVMQADRAIGWDAAALIERAREEAEGPARAAIAAIEAVLPERGQVASLDRVRTEIEGLSSDLEQALGGELATLQESLNRQLALLRADDVDGQAGFDNMYAMIETANEALLAEESEIALDGLTERLSDAAQQTAIAMDRVRTRAGRAGIERSAALRDEAFEAIEASGRARAASLIDSALAQLSRPGGFAALVESRVESDPDLEIRPIRVPMTETWSSSRTGGLDIPAEFNPRGAKAVSEAIDAVLATIGDAEAGPLDADRLEDRVRAVGRAARDYREDLAQWWGPELEERLEVEPLGSWAETYEAFRDIRVSSTNRELGRVFELAIEAMEIAAPDEDTNAFEYLESWKEQQQTLETDVDFEDSLSTVRGNWRSLSPDAARSSDRMLALAPRDFEDRYIGEYAIYVDPDTTPPIRYWSDLIRACLDSLTRDASSNAGEIARDIRDNIGRFPVVRSGVQDLSPDAVEQLIVATGSLPTGDAAAARGETLGEGAELNGYPEAREMIRRMLPTATLRPAELRAIRERARPWLIWLGGDRAQGRFDPPEWELVLLPMSTEPESKRRLTRYVDLEVEFGGRKLTWGDNRTTEKLILVDNAGVTAEQTLDLHDDRALTFRFIDPASGETREVPVRSGWTPFRLAEMGGRDLIRLDGIGTKPIWAVPISIDGGQTRYWVGIRFKQGAEDYDALDPRDWPQTLER